MQHPNSKQKNQAKRKNYNLFKSIKETFFKTLKIKFIPIQSERQPFLYLSSDFLPTKNSLL